MSDELSVDPEDTDTASNSGWTGNVPKTRLLIEKLADLGWEPSVSFSQTALPND